MLKGHNENEMRGGSTPKYSADEGTQAPLRMNKKKFKRKFPHLNSLDVHESSSLNNFFNDEN